MSPQQHIPNALPNPGVPVAPTAPPTELTPSVPNNGGVDPTAAVERARAEEKSKLYASMEAEKQARAKAEAELKLLKSEHGDLVGRVDQLTNKNLKPDERMTLEFQKLRGDVKASQDAARQTQERLERTIHAAQLERYRADRLVQVGEEIIPELVGGDTPEAIEHSIVLAQTEYQHQKTHFWSKFQHEHQQALQAQATQAQQPMPGAAAFPTPTNPQPIAGADVQSAQGLIPALTTEDAVRSGHYAQYRQQLHGMIRNVGSQGVGQFTLPVRSLGQVQQPQGFPTGPVAPPGMYMQPPQFPGQQPQQFQQAPMPVGAPTPQQVTGPLSAAQIQAARAASVQQGNMMLQQPQAAATVAQVAGPSIPGSGPGAYAPPPTAGLQPGQLHPMIRNTRGS